MTKKEMAERVARRLIQKPELLKELRARLECDDEEDFIEMKNLVFGGGLMALSLDGSTGYTIRKYRPEAHNLKKGEIVIGNFKDGLDILLMITDDVIKAPFKELKRSESEAAKKGGYYFNQECFDDLKKYYPDLTWDTMGVVIYSEVLKINGVPVVQYNWKNKKQ